MAGTYVTMKSTSSNAPKNAVGAVRSPLSDLAADESDALAALIAALGPH